MERLLAWVIRSLLGGIQALPLTWVARLGRLGGALTYRLDARHRRVAEENLRQVFGTELSPLAIRELARENFRRIGENFACAARTAAMQESEVAQVLEVSGVERIRANDPSLGRGRVMAIGHFGNFELYARTTMQVPEFQEATTYRALRQPWLNRVLQDLRERSGCLYFERRTEAAALKRAMTEKRLMIGFLADQHAGDRGLRIPFFGRDCSTSAAPAVFALRYECPLHVAVCYRVGLARWRIEVSEAIPLQHAGQPRSVEAITTDINRAFEAAVRRDPANWFWVHKRWKPGKHRPTTPSGAPGMPEPTPSSP